MEVTTSGAGAPITPPLRSWVVQSRRVGGRTYQGDCLIAHVRRASYQQLSTTFGRTAGVMGLTADGRGFVTGGGGFVDTVHQGIVSVVLEDEAGRHVSEELPAAVAVLEDSVVRVDRVEGRLVAVTNLTGRQRPTIVLDSSAFISHVPFDRRHGALLLGSLIAAGQVATYPVAAVVLAALLGIAPALRLRKMALARRDRASMAQYIAEVMS